jgi:hypothetical protein
MNWDHVHFGDGKLYVARLKNGDPSDRFLEGWESRSQATVLARLSALLSLLLDHSTDKQDKVGSK